MTHIFAAPLEEQATHTTTHSLAIVQNVELVDQLVHIVTALGQRAQIDDQSHLVALHVELFSELVVLHDWQPLAERVNLAQDFLVERQLTLVDVLDVGQHQLDPGVQHFDGAVLGQQMVGHCGVFAAVAVRHARHMVDAQSFGLLGGQGVLERDEQEVGLALDRVDCGNGFVQSDGQPVDVGGDWFEQQQNRALVDLADLLVDFHFDVGGQVAGRVPAEEVQVAEHLFVLDLFCVVVVPVEDRFAVDKVEFQLERVHDFHVATFLLADQSAHDGVTLAATLLGPDAGPVFGDIQDHWRMTRD
jgi:hypothetical protein